MAADPQGCRPAVCARRRPEQTVLYRLVQQHLETYFALACEGDGHAVPGYVERELRRYLECGILACGFASARCPDCGHDFLVAFSCKGRGRPASLPGVRLDWQSRSPVYRPQSAVFFWRRPQTPTVATREIMAIYI